MFATSYVMRTNHTVLLVLSVPVETTQTFRTVDQRKRQSGFSYIWEYFEVFVLAG